MKISAIEAPSHIEIKPILDGIYEYGLAQICGVEPSQWAAVAKEKGAFIGGATGRVHLQQFYLENLWVKEAFRSQGLGTKLHGEILNIAYEHRCSRVLLNTLNERAVSFYLRLSYKELAVIKDYVPGYDLHYLGLSL